MYSADSVDTSAYTNTSSSAGGDSPASHMKNLFSAGYTTASATTAAAGGGSGGGISAAADRRYMSYSDLQHLSSQQHDEVMFLRNENNNLKAREIEISSLSVRLQQQFAATQGQIDHLKSTVRLQLLNPITEGEYLKIESKAESDRDLLDTLKLGIYQQIGSLKAAKDTAVRKASELALENEQQAQTIRSLRQDLNDVQFARENDGCEIKKMKSQLENKTNVELEHMSRIKDLEHRLSSVVNEQERSIDARVQLQHKINEVARLEMLLRQEESTVAKYKASLDCSEQKLDILKSEYYELKLSYGQKVLQLENALRTAEDKLGLVADVELEAEVFIANLASREEGMNVGSSSEGNNGGGSSSSPLAVIPPSRRMAHALTITKKCLALENKVASLEHELRHKEEVINKLTASLDMAKSALSANHTTGNGNGGGSSPYLVIERTVEKLMKEKEMLEARNKVLLDENTMLTQQAKDQCADLKVLTSHREELVTIRQQLAAYAEALANSKKTNLSPNFSPMFPNNGAGGVFIGNNVGSLSMGSSSPTTRNALGGIDMNAKPTSSIMKNNSAGSSSLNNNNGSNPTNTPNQFLTAQQQQQQQGQGGGGGGSGGNSVRFAAEGGSIGSLIHTSSGNNLAAGGNANGGSGGGNLQQQGNLNQFLGVGHNTPRQSSYNSFNGEMLANNGGRGGGGLNGLRSQQSGGGGGGGIRINSDEPHPLQHMVAHPTAINPANMMAIQIQPPTPAPSAPGSLRGGGFANSSSSTALPSTANSLRVRPESHPDIPFCQSIIIN